MAEVAALSTKATECLKANDYLSRVIERLSLPLRDRLLPSRSAALPQAATEMSFGGATANAESR
jgi:hypothetical protein